MLFDKKVSVIIPAYNSAGYLGLAIDSVLAQTFKNVEIIVVDDGSTDNTQELIAQSFPGVTYVRKTNGGPASARNTGMARCTGEYIAFLDADDLWSPDKLEKQLAVLERDPKISLVYSQMVNFDDATGARSDAHPKVVKSGMIFDYLLSENCIHLSTVVLRASIVPRTGIFDETLLTAEDTNLWMRIARTEEVFGIAEPLVLRRKHANNISDRIGIPVGTLTSLDKIVELLPDTAPSGYAPMKVAYLRRGSALIFDHFNDGCYRDCHNACDKLLNMGLSSPRILFFWSITWLPPRVIDALRHLRRKAKPASLWGASA